MKLVLSLIGVLVMLAGAWPILNESNLIPEAWKIIPSTGMVYQGIIMLIGLVTLLYGLKKGNVKIK